MRLGYLTLLSGLLISAVAIFYSVAGLTSIFSAAFIPIIVMGVSLEVAKLVATVWLKQNWKNAPRLLKVYLIVAVSILMFITSIGIFGFLSKAHSDQTLASGDIASQLSIYDQKIQTAKDNIDADRKALQQMDAAVDQTMGRSQDEKGAALAVRIRRSQSVERLRLNNEIASQQETVAKLSDLSAPIRAQMRKVEAEVGPIKYIAQLIYGPNPSENLLERAVSWVIILIVIVFDPLAITLLLASQYSFAQAAEDTRNETEDEGFDEDDFKRRFFSSKGTVDPNIDLEIDEPVDLHVLGDIAAQESMAHEDGDEDYTPRKPEVPMIEEDSNEHMEAIEESTSSSEVKIIHTENSMIIEDSAGTQEIVTDEPRTYVQNEEQKESSKWSEILKPISEGEYREAARRRKSTSSE